MPSHLSFPSRLFSLAIALVVGVAWGAAVVAAQTPSTSQTPSTTLPTLRESVVVTATGREIPESSVGVTINVIDSTEIEQRHALSTIDLLRAVPAFVASRPGGVGNLTSVWVRGGESTYNKVLLDGMPLNEPGGAFNFAGLAPENIERIEVLRGAHSALFGSDAMASVIQIFSRRPDAPRPQVDLTVDGGTYATTHLAAGAGARAGRMDYRAFGSRLATDNRAPNNAHTGTTFSGSVGARNDSAGNVRASVRSDAARTGVPGAIAFGRPDMDAHAKHRNTVFGVSWEPQSASVAHRVSYSAARSRQDSVNLNADPPFVAQYQDRLAPFTSTDFLYHSRTVLTRHHLAYRAIVPIGTRRALTGAFELDGERGVLTNLLTGADPQRPERRNVGSALQYEEAAGPISFVGGVRFDHNGSFGFAASPRASVSWMMAGTADASSESPASTRLHASAGLGLKEPTFLQSYSPNPGFLGNPDLDPERSRGYDIGIEQRFWSRRARVDATYFANRFDDLISLRTIDPVIFSSQYFNIGETRASGLELTADAAVRGGLHVRGSYVFLDSKVIRSTSSSAIFQPGRPLFRRPRHSGVLQGSFVHGRTTLSSGVVIVGERVDSDSAGLGLTSNGRYVLVNIAGDVRLAPRTSAFVTIDNAADAAFMDPLGFPALGRAVRAGVRTRF